MMFKPPLQPIPVGGPFHRVAVDILKLPLTSNGNRYIAVFMEYILDKVARSFRYSGSKSRNHCPIVP